MTHNYPHTATHCPMEMLGCLKPFDDEHSSPLHQDAVVNGVRLSRQVIEELQRLGIALNWYHAGELKDAIIAVHHDGQLVDDHKGIHFRDMLHLSDAEKNADSLLHYAHARMRVRAPKHHSSCDLENNKKKKDEKKKSLFCLS